MTTPKEKALIEKLLNIAEKQQRIITKLAQEQDPNLDYLRRTVQVVAANCNFTPTEVIVLPTPGSTGMPRGTPDIVVVPKGYTVTVNGNFKDNDIRRKFLETFKAQVQSQKPEIADNVSILLGS